MEILKNILFKLIKFNLTFFKVTEMYSTGGDLHLELISGSQEGQKNQWKISPYHTKSLIRANFVARRENNHTAYVRLVQFYFRIQILVFN